MNQTLKDALKEVEALPEEEQEELAQALLRMAVRKKIDAELAASEAEGGEAPHEEVFRTVEREIDAKLAAAETRGGATPHEAFMVELRSRYGG